MLCRDWLSRCIVVTGLLWSITGATAAPWGPLLRGHPAAGYSPLHRIDPTVAMMMTDARARAAGDEGTTQAADGPVLVDESTVHGKMYKDAIAETNREIKKEEEGFRKWQEQNGGLQCHAPLPDPAAGKTDRIWHQSSTGECPRSRAAYAPEVLEAIERGELSVESLPVCNVTVHRAATEGMLVYRGDDYTKPYDHTCWVQKYRYHVSDRCPASEFALYRWQWTLRSAYEGRCRMPSARPRDVARMHRAAHPEVDARLKREKRPLRVVLLGISFVREEFEALACSYPEDITDGRFVVQLSEDVDDTRVASLEEVRRDGGTCHGLENTDEAYARLYPPAMNGGKQYRPQQNFYYCGDTDGVLIYNDELELCYVYAAGTENFKDMHDEPWDKCGFPATSVDAWIGTFSAKQFRNSYFPAYKGLSPLPQPSMVLSTRHVYRETIREQLARAYCCYGIEPAPSFSADFRSYTLDCETTDLHMPMPGAPDYLRTMWFSILATGMYRQFEDD